MSRGFSTRFAARGTFSAPRQLPIRWRLAGGSALLTLIILCAFAGVVGTLISDRIHEDFDDQVASASRELAGNLEVTGVRDYDASTGTFVPRVRLNTDLNEFAAPNDAVVRIVSALGEVVKRTDDNAPFGAPRSGPYETAGYRIETQALPLTRSFLSQQLFVQYGRPLADVEATIRRVRLFLVLGVLSGAGLALLAGLAIARRAMAPIAELTEAAREIERTRDPARRIPTQEAEDEIAELASTLDAMLGALDDSRNETEAALTRQREFVADASHELRTPLTSVLANLEVLAEHLDGEPREAARSALRSSQRMRRLVADLLLLARADADRETARAPTDVGEVLVEAAGELGPVADEHELMVDASPGLVLGARDELFRLALNLMQNALSHTPPGTHIHATVERESGDVRLIVEDDGPGIPEEVRDRVFERFVRASGDRGRSTGLGLAIVRAVTDSHGGTVELITPTLHPQDAPPHGTRFVVTFPAAGAPPREPVDPEPVPAA